MIAVIVVGSSIITCSSAKFGAANARKPHNERAILLFKAFKFKL